MVIPRFAGITASCPKARANMVSPVAILCEVLYAYSTPDNSLTHAPFFSLNLVFINFFMTLLAASTCSLDYRCVGEQNFRSIPSF